jgi:hypothetical protein
MAAHEVKEGEIGCYSKTLVANTEDEVSFAETQAFVEISNFDDTVKLYVTVDGTTPVVGGAKTHEIPPNTARTLKSFDGSGNTPVKLIAEAAAEYSVAKVSE